MSWVLVEHETIVGAAPKTNVRDNFYPDVPPHHTETIFAMLKCLYPRDDYSDGTGPSLTITTKIIERHGGSLWMELTYGEGSTFYLRC